MKAKKHLLDKAKQDGAAQRINELISASYMLISEALVLQSEADDTLRKYGLVYAEIKQRANALQKEFDKYFACIKSMITEEEQKEAYFTDLDNFDKVFRKYAKLENIGEPYERFCANNYSIKV